MNYLSSTKSTLNSLLFIFPFIILYEFIAFFKFKNLSYQIRNTADIIIRDFISIFTSDVMLIYSILLFFVILIYFILNINNHVKVHFNLTYVFFMYIEGFVYGFILILLLNGLTVFSYNNTFFDSDLILSFYFCLGASIWEEILFRLFCFSSIVFFLKKVPISNYISTVIAGIISSLLFSMFHYIGSLGDVFTIYSFLIRFVGGLYLSALYYYRGLGIAMICHFTYDFILLMLPFI